MTRWHAADDCPRQPGPAQHQVEVGRRPARVAGWRHRLRQRREQPGQVLLAGRGTGRRSASVGPVAPVERRQSVISSSGAFGAQRCQAGTIARAGRPGPGGEEVARRSRPESRRSRKSVTMPKFRPPPPRQAQNRSALCFASHGEQPAVGGDDPQRLDVVGGRAELADGEADAAAERQAAERDARARAGRDRQRPCRRARRRRRSASAPLRSPPSRPRPGCPATCPGRRRRPFRSTSRRSCARPSAGRSGRRCAAPSGPRACTSCTSLTRTMASGRTASIALVVDEPRACRSATEPGAITGPGRRAGRARATRGSEPAAQGAAEAAERSCRRRSAPAAAPSSSRRSSVCTSPA